MTTRAQQIKDQTIGIRAVDPSVSGIANERRKRLVSAVKRTLDAANTICALTSARDSGDDEAKRLARLLIENPEFRRAMIQTLSNIQAEVKAAAAEPEQPKDASTQPAAAADPTAGSPQPEGSEQNGQDYPEANTAANQSDPEKDKGSGLPGTDAATSVFDAYVREAAPPESFEHRHNAAADAEAAQRRKDVLAHVKTVGSAEDIARVSMGLDRRPYEGE